jgi:VWFA-related protein
VQHPPPRRLACALVCLSLLTTNALPRQQQQQQPTPQRPSSQQPRQTPQTQPQPPQSQSQSPQPQPPSAPQEVDEDEIIRLETDLVQVRAVVTDKKGRLVENLRREDFEVYEDGRPQEIGFFSVEGAVGDEATPGGVPKARAAVAPARTLVLFVDAVHLAPANLFRAKEFLKKFIDERVTDRDTVAVVSTGGTLGVLQQFTSDRRILKYAVDKITNYPKTLTAFTAQLAAEVLAGSDAAIKSAAIIIAEEEGVIFFNEKATEAFVMARAREILAEEDSLRRTTLLTLEAVSERLAKMRGQRLVAFVSNGFTSLDREGSYNDDAFRRVAGRAARSGVVIYSMYGIGLYYSTEPMQGTPSRAAEQTLRDLAHETGGRAVLNSNDIGLQLRGMLDDNRLYYSLAYYPPKGGDDKRLRKIEVRVKGHPEYGVRAQRGYVPAERRAEEVAKTPRERLFREMIAPLPATAIGVTSSADFLETASDDAQVTLQVRIDGGRLRYAEEGGAHRFECEVAAVVFDREGKIADSLGAAVNASLTPAQLESARDSGFRYTRRLKLKPGLYHVRVGVRDVASGLTGTSGTWVEVPDLRKGRLALSSLFLGREQQQSEAAGGVVNVGASRQAAAPRLIVGRASLRSGEVVSYRYVVYNAAREQKAQTTKTAGLTTSVEALTTRAEILRGERQVFDGGWQPLDARAFGRDAKGIEAGGRLRLGLSPGFYTLRVTVKDAAAKKTVKQIIDFEIEP